MLIMLWPLEENVPLFMSLTAPPGEVQTNDYLLNKSRLAIRVFNFFRVVQNAKRPNDVT